MQMLDFEEELRSHVFPSDNRLVLMKDVQDAQGRTMLYVACMKGLDSLVQKLIEIGYSSRIESKVGYLPIHTAAACGRVHVVEALLQHGDDVNATTGSQTGYLKPVLWMAARFRHAKLIQVLIARGANAEQCVCRKSVRKADDDDIQDGESALFQSAYQGDSDSVEILVKHTVDVNACTKNGDTALNAALMRVHTSPMSSSDGFDRTIAILLQHKADPTKAVRDIPPLFTAIKACNPLRVIHLLLENGAQVDAMCLRCAVLHGQQKTIEALSSAETAQSESARHKKHRKSIFSFAK